MTITTKLLLAIIGVFGISAIIFFIYQRHIINEQNNTIQNAVIQQKQLSDEIIRSQSNYVNQKGFEDFIKQNQVNLDAISSDLKSLGGKIDAVNVAVVSSQGQNANNIPSTNTTPIVNHPTVACTGPDCIKDTYGYFSTTQNLTLNENFGKIVVPFGTVSFSAGTIDNKPWSYTILPRDYKVSTTIAHSATGQEVVYNALSIKEGDKSFDVPLTSSNTVQIYPKPTFSWWNPRVALGASASFSYSISNGIREEATPSLSVSAMSYGTSKLSPNLRLISLGVGYNIIDKAPSLEFSPIMVNVAKTITGGSFFSNVYVGPVLGIDTKGTFTGGLGLQVGL